MNQNESHLSYLSVDPSTKTASKLFNYLSDMKHTDGLTRNVNYAFLLYTLCIRSTKWNAKAVKPELCYHANTCLCKGIPTVEVLILGRVRDWNFKKSRTARSKPGYSFTDVYKSLSALRVHLPFLYIKWKTDLEKSPYLSV